jgi:hypothetical protein
MYRYREDLNLMKQSTVLMNFEYIWLITSIPYFSCFCCNVLKVSMLLQNSPKENQFVVGSLSLNIRTCKHHLINSYPSD